MQNNYYHHLTRCELQDLCNIINRLHRIVWTALAVILAVCALIWNPWHLLTAGLLLLVSRAQWDVKDIEALDDYGRR